MNNTQVAQAFADRKTTGHSQNMFISDDTIFSYGYHFPIARHTDKVYFDKPVVLFTTRGYSHTTSNHKNHVWSALYKAGYYILDVDCIANDVEQWINDKTENIQNAEAKAKRARLEFSRSKWMGEKQAELSQLTVIYQLFT